MSTDGSGGAGRARRPRGRRRPHVDGEGEQITMAAENYLLSIFMVQEEGLPVTNVNLVHQLKRTPASEGLGTSPPSVAGMLKRMADDSLITVGNTAGEKREVHLTSKGKTFAERIVRRHRLAERMVVDLLGLDLSKAHVEAHRLEHAISEVLEERIRAALGNPVTCPFGHPIPGSGYSPPPNGTVPIGQAPIDTTVIVERIPEEDQELLEYLVASGIVPGAELVVVEVAPYRGVLTVRVAGVPGGETAALGLEVSERVRVRLAAG